MSMDRCVRCDAPVDTDVDLDCYYGPFYECVCERCREIQYDQDNEGYINA